MNILIPDEQPQIQPTDQNYSPIVPPPNHSYVPPHLINQNNISNQNQQMLQSQLTQNPQQSYQNTYPTQKPQQPFHEPQQPSQPSQLHMHQQSISQQPLAGYQQISSPSHQKISPKTSPGNQYNIIHSKRMMDIWSSGVIAENYYFITLAPLGSVFFLNFARSGSNLRLLFSAPVEHNRHQPRGVNTQIQKPLVRDKCLITMINN